MFSNLIARGISTSSCRLEMMNITKMQTFNKRGTKKFKKEQYKKWGKKGEVAILLQVVHQSNVVKLNTQVHILTLKSTLMGRGQQA